MKLGKIGFVVGLIIAMSLSAYGATVKIWYGWTGQEKEAILGLFSKYEQVSGNKVDALMVPFDAMQGKFLTMAPQGQGPDLIIGAADWVGPFAISKLIEPLNNLVAEADKKAFMPNVLDGCKLNGKLYGLPESYKVVALIYNKDLIKTPPKNTDEMIKIGMQLTNEAESKYGLAYNKGDFYYHIGWIGGFGGTVLDKESNPTFSSKAQIDAVRFVKSLQDKPKKIMPDEVDYNVMMALFNDGLAGMIIAGPWVVGDLMQAGIRFGVTRLPMISSTGKWPAPIVGPEMVMLSSNSKDKKAAYDLMKFITSKDAQIAMSKVGHLPSRTEVYDEKALKSSKLYEFITGFKYQAEVGYPMPTAPEMAVSVWSNGATMVSRVISGDSKPEEAALAAQKAAETSVKDLRNKK